MKKLYILILSFILSTSAFSQIWVGQNVGYGDKILGMRDLSIVNANTVWITSYDGQYPFVRNRLDFSRTTDGGKTWLPGIMDMDTNFVTATIQGISATEAWVASYKNSGGGGLFHTIDGGKTWPQVAKGQIFDDNSYPNFVHFKDSLNGIAMGDPNNGYFEIYKTTNRGVTWNRINTSKIPLPLDNMDYGTPFYYAVKNSIWFGTTGGRIIYSHDYGNTWSAGTVFTGNGFINRVAFRDTSNGICIVSSPNNASVYATSDGGATWVIRPNAANLKTGSLCAIPGTNVYLSCTQGRRPNWGTSISRDDGRTWIELEALDNRNTVAFFNSTTGWCGGFSGPNQAGGIFKYNGTALTTGLKEENNVTLTTYPNPVSNTLNVDLKELKGSKLTISITNELGQTVYTDKKEQKDLTATLKIDFSPFEDGLYFLNLSDGKVNVTNKIIKKK
jgi:photosystem II stability/assembly factor-like uncharacterized protein